MHSSLKSGMHGQGSIWAFARIGRVLYAGGSFKSINGKPFENLASFVSGSWSEVSVTFAVWNAAVATRVFHRGLTQLPSRRLGAASRGASTA